MDAPELRPLTRDDGPALLAVNARAPIEADVTVVFDRGADFFAWPDAVFDRHRYLGAFVAGELVGYAMVASRVGWRGDALEPWFYAGDARVLPEARRRGVVRALAAGLEDLVWDDIDVGFGIVKRGNAAAEGFAGWLGTRARFATSPAGTLRVALLPVLRGFSGDPTVIVRRASDADAARIAACAAAFNRGRCFAPEGALASVRAAFARPGLDPARWWLAERGGVAVGVVAAWDMGALHHGRVLRYSAKGRLIRAASVAAAAVLPGVSPLPAPGGALRVITVSHVAVGEAGVLRALLGAVSRDALGQGVHLVSCGFLADDPLLAALRGLPGDWFESTVYLSHRTGRPATDLGRPYVDLAWI